MKYELIPVTHGGTKRYRIKATASFSNVKKGQVGGFVDSELNLSQKGNCWIYDDAIVFEHGYVGGDAKVMDSAMVYDNAEVSGSAIVQDEAEVYGNAVVTDQANVYQWAKVSDKAFVGNKSQVYGNARVYGEAKVTGKASVKDRAEVYGKAKITDNGIVSGNSEIYGSAFVGYNDTYHNQKTNLTSTMPMESNVKPFKSFIKEGMGGKKCLNCKKGTYGERNIYNDWDGTVTCDKCNHTVTANPVSKPPTKKLKEGKAKEEYVAFQTKMGEQTGTVIKKNNKYIYVRLHGAPGSFPQVRLKASEAKYITVENIKESKGPNWSKRCFACNRQYDVLYCEGCKTYNYNCPKCDDEYEYECDCAPSVQDKMKKVKRPAGSTAPPSDTFSLDGIVRALGQSDIFKDFKDAKGQEEYDKFLAHNKEFKNVIDKYFTNTDKFSVGDRLHYHQQLDKSLKAFLTKLIAGKL